jgi:hypothetical protein
MFIAKDIFVIRTKEAREEKPSQHRKEVNAVVIIKVLWDSCPYPFMKRKDRREHYLLN